MKFLRVYGKGIGPFEGDYDVPLSDLPGQIVAVVGANGAGKSTFLETIPGAAYRECPTRGPLRGLARAKDSFAGLLVESRGRVFDIRQSVDGVTKTAKQEASVTDEEGRAHVLTGKVRDYDLWAAMYLTDPTVLYSSTFAPQGHGRFLDMTAGERKGVILRTLGIEWYELLAEAAREHARESTLECERLRAQEIEALRDIGSIADAELRLSQAQEEVRLSRDALAIQKGLLEEARQKAAEAEQAWREWDASHRRHIDARLALQRAEKARDDLRAKREGLEALVAELPTLRTLAEQRAGLDDLIERMQSAQADRREGLATARGELAEERARLVEAREAERRLPAMNEAIERMTLELAEARAAQASLTTLEDLRSAAAVKATETSERALRARQALTAAHDDRVGALRGALVRIRDGCPGPATVAADAIASDDIVAGDATEQRTALASIEQAASDAERERAEAENRLTNARRLAERVENLDIRMGHMEEDLANAREKAALREECEENVTAAEADVERRDAEVEEGASALSARIRERGTLLADLERLPAAERAEAQTQEIDENLVSATRNVSSAALALESAPSPGDQPAKPDYSAEQEQVELHERVLESAQAALGRAEAHHKRTAEAHERAKSLTEARRKVEAVEKDWTRLGADLGRNGLQAMEVDAAGPEISRIANELLHECFGPRWTVALETTRLSADGKRDIESFEIRVIDTATGRDGPIEGLSGGEKVIVGEALSLALTVVACAASGAREPTLVRDESGAALDTENAAAYVGMLRRAAEMVHADRVLLVSHSPEVQALCDARIIAEDGTLRVEL